MKNKQLKKMFEKLGEAKLPKPSDIKKFGKSIAKQFKKIKPPKIVKKKLGKLFGKKRKN